jgi:cytochrome o ubiquinol oxidase subunit II
MRFALSRILLAPVPAALAMVVWPSLCLAQSGSFMDPGGPVAAASRAHFISVAGITMIAVLPVLILVPVLLWRYRYGNRTAKYAPEWEFSLVLDVMMWGIPAAIVAVLSVQLWQETIALDPYRPIQSAKPPLQIQVVGLDWKWLFIYPEQGVASIGEMAFPANRPVSLTLTSDTVMQSFMIPALAGQIYVMPAMTTQQNLIADAPGTFGGQNTQFNGAGFAQQRFRAMAMMDTNFDAWTAKLSTKGVALNDAAYAKLGAQTTLAQVRAAFGTPDMPPDAVWFSTLTPGLFEGVLQKYMAGQPILPANQPGTATFDPLPKPAKVSP